MPYLMGAAIEGTQTVRGREVEVDLSASDIFSNLEFGAMGVFLARNGDWGFGSDVIWMALGAPAGFARSAPRSTSIRARSHSTGCGG